MHVDAGKLGCLPKSVLLLARPLGDVFVRGDPASIGQRPVVDLNRTPFGGLQGDALGARDMLENPGAVFVDIDLNKSHLVSMAYQIAKVATRSDHFGRQPVHLDITLIADDETLGSIEQRQALRHIFDGGIETLLFQLHTVLGRLVLPRQATDDQHEDNRGDDSRQTGGDDQEFGLCPPVGES